MINWFLMKSKPDPGHAYLVRSLLVGPVYDVAFYQGKRPDGTDWWIMGNSEIPAKAITHWAPINEPDY